MGNQSEHDEQAALFKWAKSMEGIHPELEMLYAIPNAAKRSYKLANYMKSEGMKAGVPDICLPVARSGYYGLYIEFKKTGGRNPSEAQNWWLERLGMYGYASVCCKGIGAAQRIICQYVRDEYVCHDKEHKGV